MEKVLVNVDTQMDSFDEKAYFNNAKRENLMMCEGIRIDSGDEYEQLEKTMALYKKFSIDPSSKSIIISNTFDASKSIEIHKFVNGRMKDSYCVSCFKQQPKNVII